MPSVEMRRTTRVFGARVLRSGRRLFTAPEVIKHMRRAPLAVADDDGEEGWIELLGGGGGGNLDVKPKRNSNVENNLRGDKVVDIDDREVKLGDTREANSVNLISESSRFGAVYTRKRKRSVSMDDTDKKYGKKFVRKLSRKNVVMEESPPVLSKPEVIVKSKPRLIVKSNDKIKKRTRVRVNKPTQLIVRTYQLRSGVTNYRGIQKKQRDLRSRKQRNPSAFLHLRSGGGVVKDDGVPVFPIKSNPEVGRVTRRTSCKKVKSTRVELNENIDSARCNANILVMESDRCYREGGAVVSMEMSGSKQWFLVVKKDGVERFRVEAQNVMRPCFCNRVTRAIIWAGTDESWRLEFPDRHDWLVFKELYKKCSERTFQGQASLASLIPVPRVNEVSGYANDKYVPFKMPRSYISSRGDEISRVLEKSDLVYDMDSDDYEWLNKLNSERDIPVDEDTFEKIIDALERGIYGSPEVYSDVTLAVDRCLMLASKEVLEAVYGYWMAKRKKKRSALVRVFQFYKPKKPEQLNIKAVLRKKRSFRQRGNLSGRRKQLTFLKAGLHEKNVTEDAENAKIRVQKNESAAERAEQVAVKKRQKAQLLMEIADLLTYMAAMALKIAEARATSGSVDDDTNDALFFPVNISGST